MNLPKFLQNSSDITRDDAINMILTSIAMEEVGLSHILNAEGEKIQYALGTLNGVTGPNATIKEVLQINESVGSLLGAVVKNQEHLSGKMAAALNASTMIGPTGPTGATGAAPQPIIYQLYANNEVGTVLHPNDNIPFDTISIDTTNGAISGYVPIMINTPGIYQVSWSVNLLNGVSIGVAVNGVQIYQTAIGVAAAPAGIAVGLTSLINVTSVPSELALVFNSSLNGTMTRTPQAMINIIKIG